MNDIIAFRQFRKIDVQRGAGGNRMRRLEPARALDFVPSENFRIGDDDEFRLVAHEAARDRTDVNGRNIALRRPVGAARQPSLAEAVFRPDFRETLPFTFIVAEDVNRVALPQPAMQLGEEFMPLCFGDLRFRRAFTEGTESVE